MNNLVQAMQTTTMGAAFSVLNEILSIDPDIFNGETKGSGNYFLLKAFTNGREQGFVLMVPDQTWRIVSFSEYRTSDQIVVYYGDKSTMGSDGQPKDEFWGQREMFAYNEEKDAAKFIYNYLKGL